MNPSERDAIAESDVVVVLSYFGRDDTLRCVESLATGSPEARVLVIDNGSFDGVLAEVRRRWPDVWTLQMPTNLGFSGGMNAGLSWALERHAATVTVLNNDTIVPPGVVRKLSEIARTGVAASPVVRYADGSDRVWFGGGVIDEPTSLARHLSDAELERSTSGGSVRPSQVLSGCCVTASAETWSQVGLFDERYFLNFEDSDWSVRARAAGIQLGVAIETYIYHQVSASFAGAYSYLGLYYYTRNGLFFGSTRKRWDFPTRFRFLRRHVIPVLGDQVRRGAWKESGRHAAVISCAVLAHGVHRYGRAPRFLEEKILAWK